METLKFTRALHESRLAHETYQMKLSFWNKFVIWSYTLDSSLVNGVLLGTFKRRNVQLWCQRFASTFRQVSLGTKYGIPKVYKEFVNFLHNKESLTEEAEERLVRLYIKNLQYIIKNAPPLTGQIVVYKASSPYPGLEIGTVHQKPFNSTSYRVDLNFSVFLPPDGLCCMHRITIPKNARVLILSPLLSAYPDEAEIILPYGVDFQVTSISSMPLAVPVETPVVQFINVQEQPYTLGPVFLYNYKVDCRTYIRNVKLYNSTLTGA